MSALGAFAKAASGLLVPTALVRRRVVVADDDRRKLHNALGVFAALEVKVGFTCKAAACESRAIERHFDGSGDTILRCGCTDRILSRTF